MRDVVEQLASIEGRGACTDAERRAALWLHDDLRTRNYEAWVETLWVRPQWAWSLLAHAGLGVTASLLAITLPVPALIAAAVLALSYALELAGAGGLIRLGYRRATQIVVVEPPDPSKIALWITANTDAPRTGLVFRERWRRWGARLRPGPLAWVVLLLVWVLVIAGLRKTGVEGRTIGAVQLVPTVGALLAAAVALDVLLSAWSPGASDDASGVAVALALHEELTRRAPEKLSVGLVLAGAGELFPCGFRSHLRSERPTAQDIVMLEVGPCGSGEVAFTAWHPQLVAACGDTRREGLNRPSATGAARQLRLPALHVRAVGRGGIPPRVRTEHDAPGAVDEAAMNAAYDFCLATVDRLDAALAAQSGG